MAKQDLKNKTVKGAVWSAVDAFSGQGIGFVVGIILANILSPSEYGQLAIIMIFVCVFNCIIDSGFSSALIRKKEATETDYNTAFIANLGLSIIMFTVMILSAPYIAEFFKQPTIVPLVRAMASILIINALMIVQKVRLVRRIDFKTQTRVSIISSLSSGVVGIAMAYTGFGVWSLVAQQIVKQTLNTTLLWVHNRWVPKLIFSKNSFREMLNYGWKLLVSGLIDTTWKQVYQVVIGRCYSPASLGQFERANQFANIFSSNFTIIINRVSFPVLSSIQDDDEKLRMGYRKVMKSTMFVSFVCMLGLAAIAKPMILVLIGEEWLRSVEFLQIICFTGMLHPIHALNLNILQVKGRSDLFLKLEIIKKLIEIIPVLLGIFYSIYWMLIAGVVTGGIAFFINSYYSGMNINYSSWEQIKDILPSFLIASTMAVVVYGMSYIPLAPIYVLAMQLIVGALLVIVLSEITRNEAYLEYKNIVLSFIKKNK